MQCTGPGTESNWDYIVYCVARTHERANKATRSIWLSALATTIRKASTIILIMPIMAHGSWTSKTLSSLYRSIVYTQLSRY